MKANEVIDDAKSDSGQSQEPSLAADILRGADAIAEYLFGDKKQRRKIYHLAEQSHLPVFRLGALLCARKSTLVDWIAEQEHRSKPRTSG